MYGSDSIFSETHKIDNNGSNANFVFPHICSFNHYLQHMVLANVKLNVSGYKRITFQGRSFYWSRIFSMEQPKWSWQYWHYCIVVSWWKTPFCSTSLITKTPIMIWIEFEIKCAHNKAGSTNMKKKLELSQLLLLCSSLWTQFSVDFFLFQRSTIGIKHCQISFHSRGGILHDIIHEFKMFHLLLCQ